MPRKVVDFSARSQIIAAEPFMLHFWESTPSEIMRFLVNPRDELREMGIELPDDCRIETTIENHDWISATSRGFTDTDTSVIVCNTGGGDVGKSYYKVSIYGHREHDVGRYEKAPLHSPDEQERPPRNGTPGATHQR